MAARLYLDEDIAAQVAARLQASGYNVLTTIDAEMRAKTDGQQLEFATSQGRILLTHNRKDFISLSHQWAAERREHCGIVFLPIKPPTTLLVWVKELFELYPNDGDLHNCTVGLPVTR
jgi:hypothetical protein